MSDLADGPENAGVHNLIAKAKWSWTLRLAPDAEALVAESPDAVLARASLLPEVAPWPEALIIAHAGPLDRAACDYTEVVRHLDSDRAHHVTFDGVIDFCEHFVGSQSAGAAAARLKFDTDHDQGGQLHLGADYYAQVWLDGQEIFNSLASGNGRPMLRSAHAIDYRIQAGRHELLALVWPGKAGWAFAVERTIDAPQRLCVFPDASLHAYCSFQSPTDSKPMSLTFEGPQAHRYRLDGQPVTDATTARFNETIEGITVASGSSASHALTAEFDGQSIADAIASQRLRHFAASAGRQPIRLPRSLQAISSEAVTFSIPPVMTLDHAARLQVRFRGTGIARPVIDTTPCSAVAIPPRMALDHEIELGAAQRGVQASVALGRGCVELDVVAWPDPGRPWRLAICADAGPRRDIWRLNAQAIRQHQPHLLVFTGDLANHGLRHADWSEFTHDAQPLFSQVPLLTVPGNHDHDAPFYHRFFAPPRGPEDHPRHWIRRVPHAVLIGLDGEADWTDAGDSLPWLTQTLAASADAPYVLVFNHYPAWSSGPHLRTDDSGELIEPACRAARHAILPVLQRHEVSAYFCGHDHCYERSDLPGGLVHIVSGGAGAHLYQRPSDQKQNPYRTVAMAKHHFCLIDSGPDHAMVTALTATDEVLDRIVLAPRLPM